MKLRLKTNHKNEKRKKIFLTKSKQQVFFSTWRNSFNVNGFKKLDDGSSFEVDFSLNDGSKKESSCHGLK